MANDELNNKELSRRRFLEVFSGVAIGAAFGGTLFKLINSEGSSVVAIPASEGYLIVDSRKCAGCLSCMLACSLVHEGEENLSLSRIQVLQDPYGAYPEDTAQEQCRQCVYPACVEACPTGACSVDPENGNIRTVDEEKCIGCMQCIEACPHLPARTIWNNEERHAQKCDLCANTPYWNEEGGPKGKQACVEVCPMHAIKFVSEIPTQVGDEGYDVNFGGAALGQVSISTE